MHEKVNKIKLFLDYLASFYGVKLNFNLTDDNQNYFLGRTKTIYLNKKFIEDRPVKEIFYVIAHEYKHALIQKDQDNFIENLWFLSKYIPYILFFILSTYLQNSFDKSNPYLYVLIGIVGLPLIILVNNPWWLNERKLKEEEMCDDFANKFVGGGGEYFNFIKKEQTLSDEKFLLIQNIFTLGLYSPTHPSVDERISKSLKFPWNEKLNQFL